MRWKLSKGKELIRSKVNLRRKRDRSNQKKKSRFKKSASE
jgi:hypothetical protein